jgi:hypothetical protein
LEETIRRARNIYEKTKGRPFFQKSWNDKMKWKKDQMQKCFKPTFFRNNTQTNHQGQATQNEHKTTNSFGKRPRKKTIQ